MEQQQSYASHEKPVSAKEKPTPIMQEKKLMRREIVQSPIETPIVKVPESPFIPPQPESTQFEEIKIESERDTLPILPPEIQHPVAEQPFIPEPKIEISPEKEVPQKMIEIEAPDHNEENDGNSSMRFILPSEEIKKSEINK